MSDNTKQNDAAPVTLAKRSIQMNLFRSKTAIAAAVTGSTTPIGQVIGVAYSAKDKLGRLPDGTEKTSKLIMGEFEGVNFENGEVFTSGSIYLPGYFAEEVAAACEKSSGGVQFAIEILIEPNPKSQDGSGVAYQYAIRNLIEREPTNPIEAMKRRLQAKGALRLPPPVGSAPAQIEGSVEKPAPDLGKIAADLDKPADAKPAGKGKGA